MPKQLVALLFLLLTLFLPLGNQAVAQKKGVAPPYEPIEWPIYDGKKLGIAVLTFEDGLSNTPEANWLNADSGTQIHFGLGDGLSNMLVSTLMSTNRFTITDKKIARKIFDLYSSDTAKKIYISGTGLPKVPGIISPITLTTDTIGYLKVLLNPISCFLPTEIELKERD